jgi:Tol biopolymer transport system component
MAMSSNFAAPSYLMPYPQSPPVNDYRCVVNATGTKVIFERSAADTSSGAKKVTSLYVIDVIGSGNKPTLFLQGSPLPLSSDRPDWSWETGSVAYNWIPEKGLEVGTANSDGSNPTRLKHTGRMEYPTWFPDGSLAVMNTDKSALPCPSTSQIKSDGTLVASALAGPKLWAGMPSVNRMNPNLIAFAGQVVEDPGSYNQDSNYIWVVDTSQNPAKPVPLESGVQTSSGFNPRYQGRAPWWSPDGKWVVFESYRADPPPANNGKGMYAIYLYEYGVQNGAAVQVTDPVYNMNHAKWFPFKSGGGMTPALIVAAYQPGANGGQPAWPYGIAILDVSSFMAG